MFFGLTIEKLLLIGVIAALLIGPERLPRYAEMLAQLTKRARDFLRTAKTRVQDEMGEDLDVDWRTLDPRRYDPRRIIREALLDDAPIAPPVKPVSAPMATLPPQESAPERPRRLAVGELPPYDAEAT